MAERPDGHMDVEDCTRLSRAVSEVLDAADPIKGEYLLEVSTPGIDRPLTRLKDFDHYDGYEVRMELDRIAEGRKRFRGQLAGTDGNIARITRDDAAEGEEADVLLPIEDMSDAKLVLTDDLVTLALRREKAAKREARTAKREERHRRLKSGKSGQAKSE